MPPWLQRWRCSNSYPYTGKSSVLGSININDFMSSKVNSLSLHEKRYTPLAPFRRNEFRECPRNENREPRMENECRERIQCALALLELNSDRKVQQCERYF